MVIDYKCKNCGSELVYNIESGKLTCDNCGSSFDIEQQDNHFNCDLCSSKMSFDQNSKTLICDSCQHSVHIDEYDKHSNISEYKNITPITSTGKYDDDIAKEYQCNNCGAVLVTDKDTTSTTCSFCYSPMILSDKLSGELAPLKLIPFKISIESAQDLFRKWCKNGLVTHSTFAYREKIKDIKRVYVPFWLFDLNGHAELFANCTRVSITTIGDTEHTRTRIYKVYRRCVSDYLRLPADASIKLDDEMMDKLEPFDYKDLTNFNMQYLSGILAEKYNYTDKDLFPRIKDRVSEYLMEYLESNLNRYDSVDVDKFNTEIIQKDAVYALLPIYLLNYNFEGKSYSFAINGQTGKVIGKPPISAIKVFMWFVFASVVTYNLIKLIW